MELVVEEEAFSRHFALIGEHNFKNYICALAAK